MDRDSSGQGTQERRRMGMALGSRPDQSPPNATPKRIIVFSDGTGNSSSSLFRTNVYRLYDALDLGLRKDGPSQVAYYDNGVGTSSFKLLAVLGGVFGIGLKRNLLALYCYICRNYNEGDELFAFGFSRGAFTIRLLVALVCTQGIVPYADERELQRNCKDALNRFLLANAPDKFPWLFTLARSGRDAWLRFWRRLRGWHFDVPAAHRPDFEFVGVWDTVSAYGGPIVELTRGIDQYVWPLSMTDYQLHPKVRCARHALALDDERDSFWPLLWDEVAERRATDEWRRRQAGKPTDASVVCDDPVVAAERGLWLESQLPRAGRRLRQVWFAGMHADVGGGYPDDSLAYVSLRWMIEEIDGRLDMIPAERTRIFAFANALGPMHDSRQGLNSYYRYQPRKIASLLHASAPSALPFDATLILRDPTIGEKRHRPQGLLLGCTIHRSVIVRMSMGNDNYAPIVLPRDLRIDGKIDPVSEPALHRAWLKLSGSRIAARRTEIQENAWNLVWARRGAYFITVAATVLLLAIPLYRGDPGPLLTGDARSWWFGRLLLLAKPLLPGFAADYYVRLVAMWPVAMVFAAVILAANSVSAGFGANLRDIQRAAWWDALDGTLSAAPPPSRLRRFRESRAYQRGLQWLKWQGLPFGTGVGLAVALWIGGIFYLPMVIATQVRLVAAERDGRTLCRPFDPQRPEGALAASDPCVNLSVAITTTGAGDGGGETRLVPFQAIKGQTYVVAIRKPGGDDGTVAGKWADGPAAVPLGGASFREFGWWGGGKKLLAEPFKRVFMARWLEPLIAVGGRGEPQIERLTKMDVPREKGGETCHVGTFTARRDGNLAVFLNDAVPPWPWSPTLFYDGGPGRNATMRNRGTATVRAWPASDAPNLDSICAG